MPVSTYIRFFRALALICFMVLATTYFAGITTIAAVGGSLSGLVINENGDHLANATVSVPALDKAVRTDSEGRFELNDLPATLLHIKVSYVGYASIIVDVDPLASPRRPLTVVLKKRMVQVGQITITGSPIATDPLTSPQDVQIIGSQKLQAIETASLGKILERLPGVSNISTGPQAGKPVIRGLSGNRIRVMKDGVPMEHYQFSFRHQPVLNVAQAERVEVIKGAASILYGSDALGGAVNVITRPLPAGGLEKPYLSGLIKGQYFSGNRERAEGGELEGSFGTLGYRIGFTGRQAGNFVTPDKPTYAETNTSGTPKFTGELPFTNFDQYSGYVLVGTSGSYGNIQVIYDHYDSEQNYLLGDGNPIAQNLENDNVKLKGNILLSPNLNLKPTFSFQRNVRQATPGACFEDSPEWKVDLVRSVYVARLDLVHTDWYGLNGTVGIDLNVQNQTTLASGLLPNADIFDLGLFVFEELSQDCLTVNAGLRFDYRKHEAEANEAMRLPDTAAGETDEVLIQDYSILVGSAGASYRLTEFLTVASNFGIGFRAPDLFELHACGIHGGVQAFQIGNPYLDPERSYSIDAGLRLRTDRAVARATVYHNRIDNYIFLRNQNRDTTIGTTTLPILSADQTDGTITGLELSAEVDVLQWLQVKASYSTTTSDNKATGEELPLMPADRMTIGMRFSAASRGILGSPFCEVRMKHVMAKKSAGTYEPFSQFDIIPFGTASTNAYTILNLALGTTLNINGQPVSLHLEVENLFDEAYVDFLDTYKGYALSMGRNVRLRIQVPIRLL